MLNKIAKNIKQMRFVKGFLCFRIKKYHLFLLFVKAYSLKNNPQKCCLGETKIVEDVQDKMILCVGPHD